MVVVVQWPGGVQLFVTPCTAACTAACQSTLSFTLSWSLPKFMSIELVMPSKHLILCHPLLLLPSIFPASESFPVSWLFTSGGQILELQHQSFPLRLTVLISLQSKGILKSSLGPQLESINSLALLPFFIIQLSHNYWKDYRLNYTDVCRWSVFGSHGLHFYMPISLFISLSIWVI